MSLKPIHFQGPVCKLARNPQGVAARPAARAPAVLAPAQLPGGGRARGAHAQRCPVRGRWGSGWPHRQHLPLRREGRATASCLSGSIQQAPSGCVSSTAAHPQKHLYWPFSRFVWAPTFPQAPFHGVTCYLFTSDGRFSVSPTKQTFRSALFTLHFNSPRDSLCLDQHCGLFAERQRERVASRRCSLKKEITKTTVFQQLEPCRQPDSR